MNKFRYIPCLVVLLVMLGVFSGQAVAQSKDVPYPEWSAMDNLFQNPERWSGSRYSYPKSFTDRLYVNSSVGIGKLWDYDDKSDLFYRGLDYDLGVGVNLSPVHALELGGRYNDMNVLGKYYGVDLSYLFDVTAYASRLEEPKRWQLLLKTGVAVDFVTKDNTVLGFNAAMRLQYNIYPYIGIYTEPNLSVYSSPRYSVLGSRGSVLASARLGFSFNIGGIKEAYRERQARFSDPDYITIPFMAVKSNLLFDAVSFLNIGFEIPIRSRFSINADYTFPWWVFDNGEKDSKRHRMELLNVNIEGRYWFGDRHKKDVLTGWFAGIHFGGGLYDFEFKREGYQGEFYIAAGASGGYAHKINKKGNLRMEYALGIGYLKTDYSKYTAEFIDGEWQALRRYDGIQTWFGPTQVKVSLSWLWNRSVKRKGGRI